MPGRARHGSLRPHDGGSSLALRREDTEAPVVGIECLEPGPPAPQDVAETGAAVIDGDQGRLASVSCPLSGLPPEKWSSLMYGLWPDSSSFSVRLGTAP